MQRIVCGQHLARMDRFRPAAVIADEAARLTHQQAACRRIPFRKAAFPETIEPALRHISQIERGRAEAANAGDFRADPLPQGAAVAPIVADGTLYIITVDGKLHAFR